MWKTTAATLDFAAVMAVASRIYRSFNTTYADKMLTAAKKAWDWAKANPKLCYHREDGPTSTCTDKSVDPTNVGPYEDNNVNDEFYFAAAALATVVTSAEQTSLGLLDKITGTYSEPAAWQSVGVLGNYEIIKNKDKFSETLYNSVLNALTKKANSLLTTGDNGYGLPFNNVFWWGSNSNIGNIGILLMEVYEATKDIPENIKYKNAAQATFDYFLGRNPIDQSYVTGYGNKSPKHPHDRITMFSYGGKAFPGQLVGGAASGCYDDGTYKTYLATRYEDNEECAAWNEIAINWNAPLVYLSAALSESGSNADIVTKIDRFASGSDVAITGEPWYNFIVANGSATASISNEGSVVNASGYAELATISLSGISDWSKDWAQATIGLDTKENGTLYDLSECSNGFRYKYDGSAHRFSLESSSDGKAVTHYSDISAKVTDWTQVTLKSYERDEYDEAYSSNPNIPLNLSKIESIRWTVRPSASATSGYLKIKDFECLGALTVHTTPVRQPQIASSPLFAYAASNAIIIKNLPNNAKAEIYNLQGKRIYSTHSGNSQILRIPVQTKGVYIIRASYGSEIKTAKVQVK